MRGRQRTERIAGKAIAKGEEMNIAFGTFVETSKGRLPSCDAKPFDREKPGCRSVHGQALLLFCLAASACLLFGARVFAQPVLPVMRISVENTPSHVQTRAVRRFADEITEKLAGKIDVRFYDSAALFRDKEVIAALGRDKVEMAVPGTWQIDRYEPNAGIFLLPFFYGQPAELNHRLMDDGLGTELNRRIEQSLQAKVLGRWIDLGHAHLYGVTREIRSHEDIAGMRIRVAGGVANAMRIEAMGGLPRVIAWPDLPARMAQGMVDGVLTTHETVASARLWEAGIRFAFEDREYFPQYVPLINARFWQRLSPAMRAIIADTWEQHVDSARAQAARSQTEARALLASHGVKIATPSPEVLRQWRQRLKARQPGMVATMNIDPALLKMVEQSIADMPQGAF